MSGQLIIGVGGNQSSSSSIPKNSVTSDMVKSIVVTDSAPIKEDNVLYFEYEPVSSVVLRSSAEKKSQDLVVTIQTNTPNVEPTSQVKFSLLVTQTIDNTRVVATFDNKKSLYSNTSSQYVKQS